MSLSAELQAKQTAKGIVHFLEHELLCIDPVRSYEEGEISRLLADKKTAYNNALSLERYDAAVMMLEPKYRLSHLINYIRAGGLELEKAAKIARNTWIELNEVYPYRHEWSDIFHYLINVRHEFMTPKELEHLNSLPDHIKIYRGYNRSHKKSSLSWTMSKLIASQFARQFKEKKIAQALIRKSDVIAYLSARGQHEIIVRAEQAVINQRAVNIVTPQEHMNWAIANGGTVL